MRRLMITLGVILGLVPLAWSQAQTPLSERPLIYNSEGDLWRFDPARNAADNITEYGFNEQPVVNGATGLIAYGSVAQAWLDTGVERSGPVPTNIWVIDPVTAEAFRVASQPDNASVEDESFLYRSTPVWSPDGAYLAWTDYDYSPEGNDTYFLNIYNRLTATTERAPMLVEGFYGISGPLPLYWSPDGAWLMTWYIQWDEENQREQFAVDFYDPTLMLTGQTVLVIDGFPRETLWLTHQGEVLLGAYVADDEWLLIDPATQSQTAYNGEIIGDVENAETGGLRVIFDDEQWQVEYAVERREPLVMGDIYMRFDNLALSPEGQYLAYVEGDTLKIINANGTLVSNYAPEQSIFGLAWGEMRWQTALQ